MAAAGFRMGNQDLRSVGVLEYWSIGKDRGPDSSRPSFPILLYSITPLPQYIAKLNTYSVNALLMD